MTLSTSISRPRSPRLGRFAAATPTRPEEPDIAVFVMAGWRFQGREWENAAREDLVTAGSS